MHPPVRQLRSKPRLTGAEVLIGVSDHGPEIPVDEREKIFQRFYRLNRNHRADMPGSGLGLAICRGIVERAEPGATEVRTLAAYVAALGGRLEISADIGGERIMLR